MYMHDVILQIGIVVFNYTYALKFNTNVSNIT